MKIKKLASLVTRAKQLYLYDMEHGAQWAGVGDAIYLLPQSLPRMNETLLTLIMDIKPEKAAEFHIEHEAMPANMPTWDESQAELELIYEPFNSVTYDGVEMIPLINPGAGVYFINSKYLSPINDAEQPGLYLRKRGGENIIAVKDGLFLTALIKPVQHKPAFFPWLGEIIRGTVAVRTAEQEEEEC